MARYVLLALPYALQLLCIVHAMRTGREHYWIWIVLFLPYVGGLAYLIVEILPGLRLGRHMAAARTAVNRVLVPGKKLRDLKSRASFSPTVENRTAYADALAEAGAWSEALAEYEACLGGLARNNPAILYKAAAAAYGAGDFERATGYLVRLPRKPDGTFEQKPWNLLHLAVLERSAAPEIAASEYERFCALVNDRELDCLYLEFLERNGGYDKLEAALDRIRAEEESLRGMNVRYDKALYRRAYAVGKRTRRPE
jgi:hypothetical protein